MSKPAAIRCWAVLSEDERERAARFRFDFHRRRFIVSRGMLRLLLSKYVSIQPECISFQYGEYGKPYLDQSSIHFNLSHSEDQALFGFTRIGPIGVDVESIRSLNEMSRIATDYFSPLESEALMRLPLEEQKAAFFRCWTRKEALIKATGLGLSYPLHSFAVNVGRSLPAVINFSGDVDASHHWTLHQIEPEPGFVGTAAVRSTECTWLDFQFYSSE